MASLSDVYVPATVGERRRSVWYPPSVGVPYPSPMGDGQSGAEDWASYLKRMTARPGWSVARLARESGIHRATIFGWIAGDSGVMVANVLAVARALGDEPGNALLAAGAVDNPDPAEDVNVRLIMAANVSEDVRQRMLARYRRRVGEARQRVIADIEADLADLGWTEEQQRTSTE